jgi:hypothetical protein
MRQKMVKSEGRNDKEDSVMWSVMEEKMIKFEGRNETEDGEV